MTFSDTYFRLKDFMYKDDLARKWLMIRFLEKRGWVHDRDKPFSRWYKRDALQKNNWLIALEGCSIQFYYRGILAVEPEWRRAYVVYRLRWLWIFRALSNLRSYKKHFGRYPRWEKTKT